MDTNIVPFPTVPRRFNAPKLTTTNPFAAHELFECDQLADDLRTRNCTLDELPPAFPKSVAQPSRWKRLRKWLARKWDQFLCPHWRTFEDECVDCRKSFR